MYKNIFFSALLLCAALSYSQVGIGTTTPNVNALLDINATTTAPGGLLIPRLELTGTSNAAPLSAHVAGMTVYNTATVADVTPGFYFNNGSQWVRPSTASSQQVMLRNNIASSSSNFNFPDQRFNTITGASYNSTNHTLALPTGIYEIESNLVITSKSYVKWGLVVNGTISSSSIVGTATVPTLNSDQGSTHQVGFIEITASTAEIRFQVTEGSATVTGSQCWLKIKKIQ
jgi:hypothetical protein